MKRLLTISLVVLGITLIYGEDIDQTPNLRENGSVEWNDSNGQIVASVNLVTNIIVKWYEVPISKNPKEIYYLGFESTNKSLVIIQRNPNDLTYITNTIFIKELGQSKAPKYEKVEYLD